MKLKSISLAAILLAVSACANAVLTGSFYYSGDATYTDPYGNLLYPESAYYKIQLDDSVQGAGTYVFGHGDSRIIALSSCLFGCDDEQPVWHKPVWSNSYYGPGVSAFSMTINIDTNDQVIATNFSISEGDRILTYDLNRAYVAAEGGPINKPYDYQEWSVSAVPTPSAVWLFSSGFFLLVGLSRRNRK